MVKEIFDRGTVRNMPINKYLVLNVFIAVGNNFFFFHGWTIKMYNSFFGFKEKKLNLKDYGF